MNEEIVELIRSKGVSKKVANEIYWEYSALTEPDQLIRQLQHPSTFIEKQDDGWHIITKPKMLLSKSVLGLMAMQESQDNLFYHTLLLGRPSMASILLEGQPEHIVCCMLQNGTGYFCTWAEHQNLKLLGEEAYFKYRPRTTLN